MKQEMRIYISVPMNGRSEAAIMADIVSAEATLSELGYTPVRPIMEQNKDRNDCLGKAVTTVLNCDGIYLCKGWQYSRGCLLEKATAYISDDKMIIYYDQLN